uniref:Uncharacterized protein n=1 Tax=Pararge aegeria TaxID=116150 RepID=S4PTD3_9NEOP
MSVLVHYVQQKSQQQQYSEPTADVIVALTLSLCVVKYHKIFKSVSRDFLCQDWSNCTATIPEYSEPTAYVIVALTHTV